MELKKDDRDNLVGFVPTREGLDQALLFFESEWGSVDLYEEGDEIAISEDFSVEVVYKNNPTINDCEMVVALKENGVTLFHRKYLGYYSSYDGDTIEWRNGYDTQSYEKTVTLTLWT